MCGSSRGLEVSYFIIKACSIVLLQVLTLCKLADHLRPRCFAGRKAAALLLQMFMLQRSRSLLVLELPLKRFD